MRQSFLSLGYYCYCCYCCCCYLNAYYVRCGMWRHDKHTFIWFHFVVFFCSFIKLPSSSHIYRFCILCHRRRRYPMPQQNSSSYVGCFVLIKAMEIIWEICVCVLSLAHSILSICLSRIFFKLWNAHSSPVVVRRH